MGNTILKSLLYLILSTFFVTIFILFNSNIFSFKSLYYLSLYLLKNYTLFIFFLSIYLYTLKNYKSESNFILFILFLWVIFVLIINYLPKFDFKFDIETINQEIYIVREYKLPNINLFDLNILSRLQNKIINWNYTGFTELSSLILFLFLSSLLNLAGKSSLIKSLLFIFFILFLLNLWNSSLNTALIILSFLIFKIGGEKSETN